MHEILDKKFYLGLKFGTLFNNKWITISELLQLSHLIHKLLYKTVNIFRKMVN
jgi:hypothetical protein